MTFKHAIAISISAALMAGSPMPTFGADSTVVVTKANLKWKDMGNGVAAAAVSAGAYFALTNKASHTAKVEGNEEAVFFIQADGSWNVVMEK